MARYSLRQMLLEDQQLIMPCVYDAFGAKALEDAGFKTTQISGSMTAYAVSGLPDMAMNEIGELVWGVEKALVATDKISIAVDFDDGYGTSPAVVYKNARRLAFVGAAAIQLEDSTGIRGVERVNAEKQGITRGYTEPVLDLKSWLIKIRAAVAACEGTDCFVISRTNCFKKMGVEEAIRRSLLAREAGAMVTMIHGHYYHSTQDGEIINKYDPGLKMWPNFESVDGKSLVDLKTIDRWNYKIASCHLMEKAQIYGNILAAKHSYEDQNLEYVKKNMI